LAGLDIVAQLDAALVIHAVERCLDARAAQGQTGGVEPGMGAGQLAFHLEQVIVGQQFLPIQAPRGGRGGFLLAHIGLIARQFGRPAVAGESQQHIAGGHAAALVEVQRDHAGVDLRAQIDPAPGLQLPLYQVLALHRPGLAPFELHLRQGILTGNRLIGRRLLAGLEPVAGDQPEQQGDAQNNGQQPGTLEESTQHDQFPCSRG